MCIQQIRRFPSQARTFSTCACGESPKLKCYRSVSRSKNGYNIARTCFVKFAYSIPALGRVVNEKLSGVLIDNLLSRCTLFRPVFTHSACRPVPESGMSVSREALIAKRGRIQSYLDTLKNQELITEFDEVLWYGTVEQVRVKQDGKLRFIFKDETEIEI